MSLVIGTITPYIPTPREGEAPAARTCAVNGTTYGSAEQHVLCHFMNARGVLQRLTRGFSYDAAHWDRLLLEAFCGKELAVRESHFHDVFARLIALSIETIGGKIRQAPWTQLELELELAA